MQVICSKESLSSISVSAIVIGLFEDTPFDGFAAEFDSLTGGMLTRLVECEEFKGTALQTVTLYAAPGIPAMCTQLVGLGKRDEFNEKTALRAASAAAKTLGEKERKDVAFFFPSECTEAAVCGAMLGSVGQDLYRAERNLHPFETVHWVGTDANSDVSSGEIFGNSLNLTRELINRPACDIYPESLANRASSLADQCGLEVEVWDRARLENEKCGSLLAVSRGSAREPRLVILEHKGGPDDQPPIALVGKGVTFDSGGLSLKPSESMKEMKCDMGGAATVLGAIQAIAQLNLPVNVIALVGLVENMVSGDSYKLGDVLTARSGKTIEVLNTDAEGRLVLADVLNVAVERGASHIIDLATLTGACLVALGKQVAGVMTNDESFCDELLAAASRVGDDAWQLPMFDDYGEQIKSKVADIKNVGEGRWGGAITAAKFLEEFVDETPWVHIDIAGPSFLDSAKPWIDGGGTGAFVRTLVEVVRRRA